MLHNLFTNPAQNPVEWQEKLVKAQCPANLAEEVIKTKTINDYNQLYTNFAQLLPAMKPVINELWQLLVLSGSNDAFIYAKEMLGMDKYVYGKLGINPLHCAALSGVPEQISNALALDIPFHSTANKSNNVLHYAILSGSHKQVLHILELEQLHHHVLPRKDGKNRTVLHFAAVTNNPKIVETALTLMEDISVEDADGYNALDYAYKYQVQDNTEIIKLLTDAGLTVHSDLSGLEFGDPDTRQYSYSRVN